jgi:hypothetical protein
MVLVDYDIYSSRRYAWIRRMVLVSLYGVTYSTPYMITQMEYGFER